MLPRTDALAQALQSTLVRSLARHRLSGATASVHLLGWSHDCAAGHAGDARRTRLLHDSKLLGYSVSKMFTAALALKLARQVGFSLDDPLARFLPRLPRAHEISLRLLLQHRAGISNYTSWADITHARLTTPDTAWSDSELLQRLHWLPVDFDPGTRFAYSNSGYFLLRLVLEHATGRPFATLVAQELLEPLGLSHSYVPTSRSSLTAMVPTRSRRLGSANPREVREALDPAWVATGTVVATAGDLARFAHGLFSHRVLPPGALQQMSTLLATGTTVPNWLRPSYGLGLMGDPHTPYGQLLGHTGDGPGNTACVLHATDVGGEPATVAVLVADEASAEGPTFDLLAELATQAS